MSQKRQQSEQHTEGPKEDIFCHFVTLIVAQEELYIGEAGAQEPSHVFIPGALRRG